MRRYCALSGDGASRDGNTLAVILGLVPRIHAYVSR
jgi:hypothetical protein